MQWYPCIQYAYIFLSFVISAIVALASVQNRWLNDMEMIDRFFFCKTAIKNTIDPNTNSDEKINWIKKMLYISDNWK